MTAKKFFEQFQTKLVEHLKKHRPEQVGKLGEEDITIGNFEQVLAVMTSLFERDARVDEDLQQAKRQMREMAEDYGLSEDEIDAIEEDPSGSFDN